jgi:hypothetical protein
MRVFRLGEIGDRYDYVAAETPEEARTFYLGVTGIDTCPELEECDANETPIWFKDGESAYLNQILDSRMRESGSFPCILVQSEQFQ